MSKKIVHYSKLWTALEIGQSAIITPLDHPDVHRVSNNVPATTSKVVRIGTEDWFETENTIYVLSS